MIKNTAQHYAAGVDFLHAFSRQQLAPATRSKRREKTLEKERKRERNSWQDIHLTELNPATRNLHRLSGNKATRELQVKRTYIQRTAALDLVSETEI